MNVQPAPVIIWDIMFLLIICSVLRLGFSCMNLERAGSPPNARAASVSITRFTHRIWITDSGLSIPMSGQMKLMRTAETLLVSWNTMNFLMELKMVLP